MIVIIDYGMGNLGSVFNMFKRIGVNAIISSDLNVISKAPKLLLPGVGAFDSAMMRIKDSGMLQVLNQRVLIPGNWGSMGWDLPTTIGACIAIIRPRLLLHDSICLAV